MERKDIFTTIPDECMTDLIYCAKEEIEGKLKDNEVPIDCSSFSNIPIKCDSYIYKSISQDLRISCNLKHYYPKIDETTRYIDCYQYLEGYYLDINIFKPCYFIL